MGKIQIDSSNRWEVREYGQMGKGTECEEGKGTGGGSDKFNNEMYII